MLKLKLALKKIIYQFPFLRPFGVKKSACIYETNRSLEQWLIFIRNFRQIRMQEELEVESKITGNLYNDRDTFLYNQLRGHFFKRLPAIRLFMFPNCTVHTDEGLVYYKNYLIDESTHYFGLDLKNSRFFNLSNFFTNNFTMYDGNIAVIATNGSHNYYHWLIDALPRVSYYLKYDDLIDYYIVPENLSSFHWETLKICGIPTEKIKPLGKNEKIKAKHTWFSSVPSAIGCASPDSILFLKDRFLPENIAKTKRIYISRRNARWRKIVNESEIIELLKNHGFEILEFNETITVQEQAQIFSSAKVIIAPHGAALANLVFASDCTVCELVSPDYFGAECYFTLSGQNNIQYNAILGELENSGNYKIETKHLFKFLNGI